MTLVTVSEKLIETVIEQHSERAMHATGCVHRELFNHRSPFRTAEEVW